MASHDSTLLLVDPLGTYTVPFRVNCIVTDGSGLLDGSNTSNLQNTSVKYNTQKSVTCTWKHQVIKGVLMASMEA